MPRVCVFFFFNDTAPTEIYTLSLHDALPISRRSPCSSSSRKRLPGACAGRSVFPPRWGRRTAFSTSAATTRSEEHTSELQSQSNLVCRLLLEKKNKLNPTPHILNLRVYARRH